MKNFAHTLGNTKHTQHQFHQIIDIFGSDWFQKNSLSVDYYERGSDCTYICMCRKEFDTLGPSLSRGACGIQRSWGPNYPRGEIWPQIFVQNFPDCFTRRELSNFHTFGKFCGIFLDQRIHPLKLGELNQIWRGSQESKGFDLEEGTSMETFLSRTETLKHTWNI